MTNRSYTVTEGAAGERLDVFIAAALGRSRNQAQRLLDAGLVRVGDKTHKANYLVQPSDVVLVTESDVPKTAPPPAPLLTVVYEDAAVMVIDKPAGLVAHGADSAAGETSVADFARAHTQDADDERPGIVHRLDRDTSGLMLIAKTVEAKADLQAQFKQHTVRKTYTMLVVGRVKPPSAVIRLPLGRDETKPLRRAVTAAGKEAVTRYTTLATYPGYTLVEASPETGRTHQLRVHFAAIGHPVAGDTTYGPAHRSLALKRQFLHASAISFVTPATNTEITLTSPLPSDLADVLHNRLDSD